MASSPRFSVVITCHNQRDFIRAAVDSAVSQPIGLREIIVVDDGSTDGSQAILGEYADSIQLLALPRNQGAIAARNHGASHARGEYLVFLDGDDLLMPWALNVYERIVAERNPTLILANSVWFKEQVPALREQDIPGQVDFVEYPTLLEKDRTVGLSASTYVVKRQQFQEVGGWTPGIFQLDLQDLSTKLALSRLVLVVSPATAFYRIHSSNSILSVPPFLRNLHLLLEKEKRGQYPGGRKHRFARRGWLGGLAVFWLTRAVRDQRYREAWKLVVSAWTMMMVATVRRAAARTKGRCPIQTLALRVDGVKPGSARPRFVLSGV